MSNDKILQNITSVHFIGIGGISLSALAKLMASQGKIVTGSDTKKSKMTDSLKKFGILVSIGHKANNIKNPDVVVFTSAIKPDNIELKTAKHKHILTLERADFLSFIASEYENIIAVSGSHGKTTTCGMIASIFICAKLNPTVHIGGESETTNGNMYIGDKKFFITEACEYKDSFLKLKQTVGVILNIEYDHSDYFKSVLQIIDSFDKFSKNSSEMTIIEEKHKHLLSDQENIITFGFNNANFTAKNIMLNNNFHITFDCYINNEFLEQFELSSPINHNVYNALASIAVAKYYNVPVNDIKQGLLLFKGIKRRFEFVREFKKNIIIHDYAHHPTELLSTIKACQSIYNKPLIAVFQPHTYSRTKSFMKDFLGSFSSCDQVFIVKTYKAREKKIKGGSAKDLYNNLKFIKKNCVYFSSFVAVKNYIKRHHIKNNIILVLGAGDIEELAYNHLK
ncbi:MAG: UDP-N-acetylmuramate--L-alanine ligase [Tenericutes bacterium HGW-Tenericutes-4]|nr:MAG: UDP-N-acetylmuramate--L-alanine ligase [Tenericutes bacterium HGW-Tenericutes-4]